MTDTTLTLEETLLDLDLPLEPLDEAGGVVSWLKRQFTGTDADVLDEIRKEVRSIRTTKEKYEALRFIDQLIQEAQTLVNRGWGKELLITVVSGGTAALGATSLAWLATALAYVAVAGTGQIVAGIDMFRQKNIDAGINFGTEMVKKGGQYARFANVAGHIGAGYAATRAVAGLFRTIQLVRGSVHDYLYSLMQLREEVAVLPTGD